MKANRKYTARFIAGILCLLVLFCAIFVTTARAEETRLSNEILSFETGNMVLNLQLLPGTPLIDAGLPATLRAVVRLDAKVNPMLFSQAQPAPHEQVEAYIPPERLSELYVSGERVKYTLYSTNGAKSYRCFGKLDGGANEWYACDDFGQILGAIVEIPVTWTGVYNPAIAGTYALEADLGSWVYADARPYAMLTVQSDTPAELTATPTPEPIPEETPEPTQAPEETAAPSPEPSPSADPDTETTTPPPPIGPVPPLLDWLMNNWWIPLSVLTGILLLIVLIVLIGKSSRKKKAAPSRWWDA
ncbi:MAG: hypothetical protein FWF10_04465 [Clostridiales bacterium]|nr:hypothetical protein [Clostridiales bacterium]